MSKYTPKRVDSLIDDYYKENAMAEPWTHDDTSDDYRAGFNAGLEKGFRDGILYDEIESRKYIDLGLPSGKLWASENEDGYYSFDEATEKFKENLPTKEDFEELIENTTHIFDEEKEGMVFKGKNGNILFLPANGYCYGSTVYCVGYNGQYWSSSLRTLDPDFAYELFFNDSGVGSLYYDSRDYGYSVRLVK